MKREDNEKIVESVKKVLELFNRRDLEGDVFAVENESITHEIERDEISDSLVTKESGIGIRVLKNDKIGFGYASPGREKEGVDKAEELSPLSEELSIQLPETDETPDVVTFDKKVDEKIRNREGIDMATKMVNGCRSVSDDIVATRGEISLFSSSKVLANSKGTFLKEEGTSIGANINATIHGDRTSLRASESRTSRRLDIDFQEVGDLAGEKVDSMREKASPKTGKTSVVLRPDALGQLLAFSVVPALFGENVRKGKSIYEGKLGEKIASQNLEIIENEIQDWGLGSSGFDDEGVKSRKMPIISNGGKLRNFLYNLKEAEKSGAGSTANGKRSGFKSPPDIGARNFVLRGEEVRQSELLESGNLLVDNIMGAHTANPVSGDFSVVVNPGWMLKDSEKSGRVDGVMISGNLPKLLEGIELGKDYKKASLGTQAMELPSALLRDMNVSAQ